MLLPHTYLVFTIIFHLKPRKHLQLSQGLESSHLFPSPTGRQVKKRPRGLKNLYYTRIAIHKGETPWMLAFKVRDSFPVGEKVSHSLCVSKHVPFDSVTLLHFANYNHRTVEVLRASWFFFRLAFQWGMEKGRKIQSLVGTEDISRSIAARLCSNKLENLRSVCFEAAMPITDKDIYAWPLRYGF